MSRLHKWHALVSFPQLPLPLYQQRIEVEGWRSDVAARRAVRLAIAKVKHRRIGELKLTLVRIQTNGKGTQLPLHA